MLDRKAFLTGIAGVTVTLIVTTCGGDDDGASTGAGDGDCADDIDVAITSNHGHELSIPAADFDSGQAKSYSIKGTADHDHSVSITAQDFTNMKAGQKITKESSNTGGHAHPMQIVC